MLHGVQATSVQVVHPLSFVCVQNENLPYVMRQHDEAMPFELSKKQVTGLGPGRMLQTQAQLRSWLASALHCMHGCVM